MTSNWYQEIYVNLLIKKARLGNLLVWLGFEMVGATGFEPFEDVSKPSPSIDAMMISYGCVYKRSSKPVMKGSRVETVEAARKEYKELLNEGWKKTSIFNNYF